MVDWLVFSAPPLPGLSREPLASMPWLGLRLDGAARGGQTGRFKVRVELVYTYISHFVRNQVLMYAISSFHIYRIIVEFINFAHIVT
jgi:hypothetical protein